MYSMALTASEIEAQIPKEAKTTCMHSQLHEELRMRVPAKWHIYIYLYKKVVILQRHAVTQYSMDDVKKKSAFRGEIQGQKGRRI